MSEFLSGNGEMSSVAEASILLKQVAGRRAASDSVKALIHRAARRLHWKQSRTKDIWYEDARRIDSFEMDTLRAEAARVEIEEARTRLLALRNGLAATDPDFHRDTIDALERALRGMGCAVGPVAFQERRQMT